MNHHIRRFHGECLRKKKLSENYAVNVINRAKKEGSTLFKYYCNHCQHWHVTKDSRGKNESRTTSQD